MRRLGVHRRRRPRAQTRSALLRARLALAIASLLPAVTIVALVWAANASASQERLSQAAGRLRGLVLQAELDQLLVRDGEMHPQAALASLRSLRSRAEDDLATITQHSEVPEAGNLASRYRSYFARSAALLGGPTPAAAALDVAALGRGDLLRPLDAFVSSARGEAAGESLMATVTTGGTVIALSAALALLLLYEGRQRSALILRGERLRHESEVKQLNERATERLRHQALHDPLTGLANLTLLRERIDHALRRSLRDHAPHALIFLDLDGFKAVNDTFGHGAGDELLKEVARRWSSALRGGDTLARMGGDEFAVFAENTDVGGATAVGEKLLGMLTEPITLEGHATSVSASVGIVVSAGERDVDSLLSDSDAAMYTAKRAGKGRYEIFKEDMGTAVRDRRALRAELQRAIRDGELFVAYQPIISLTEDRVVALEALARWDHPTRGRIAPDVFIPIAEETGLIRDLDALVLRSSCAEAASWGPGASHLAVSVNLSVRELENPRLIEMVQAALAGSGLDPSRLAVELTETAAGDEEEGVHLLRKMKALGIALFMDDFGTGYSTLTRLATFPFTKLKIDRGFIRRMTRSGDGASVVQAMITMAHSLRMEAVAEGVETAAELVMLREYGCDHAQGFLLSHPLHGKDLREYLRGLSAASSGLAVGDRARPLLAELERVTGLESTYVTRIDGERAEQEIVVAHNAGDLVIAEGVQVAWANTLCRRALESGPAATDDVPTAFPDVPLARQLGLRTYVSVPLVGEGGDVIGTLCGASRRRVDVGDSTLQVMTEFARLIVGRTEGGRGERTRSTPPIGPVTFALTGRPAGAATGAERPEGDDAEHRGG